MAEKANTSAAHIPPVQGPPRAAGDAAKGPVASISMTRLDLVEAQGLIPDTTDPERHYRWVHKDRVPHRKRLGYVVETVREGGPQTVVEHDQAADGTIRLGDTVLMSCPKDHRAAREAELTKINEARLGAADEKAKARARELGVKLIEDREK